MKKRKKRVTKEELSENVLSSIERYYNNVSSEVKYFSEEIQKLMLYIISGIYTRYQKVTEGKIQENNLFMHNECLFMNTHYDKHDLSVYGYGAYEFNTENTVSLDDYYKALSNKVDEYSSLIESEFLKNIKHMEKTIGNYDERVKDEINKDLNLINKSIANSLSSVQKLENNYNIDKEKHIRNAEREFKKYCKLAYKSMKQKKKVL